MMTSFTPLLKKAKENHYAIGAFNVYNYETIRAAVDAVKETEQSAIVAFGKKYLTNMTLKEVVNLFRTMTVGLKTEIVLHLDHCDDIDTIIDAIDAGFTSVMYDGSKLPFEENLENTKKVVEYAHKYGVSVEAELGALELGTNSNEDEGETIYTDPEEARIFVEKTNVDALAVSIGTVHGLYKGEPKISVDRLKEIKANTDLPLVLHGGSGTPKATIDACIKEGITKINVNTEISHAVVSMFKDTLMQDDAIHFSRLSMLAIKTAKERIIDHMKMFRNV